MVGRDRWTLGEVVREPGRTTVLLELQIRALSKITDERQDDAIQLSLKQSNHTQAKNQYEQARSMLNEMKQKQQETRVALQMPMTPLIIRQRPN